MASALAEAVSKVPFFLPETWPSERLPQMTRLICRQIEEQWPPFVDHWYGERYREFTLDPDWLARSFLANADKEAEGSRKLWKIAGGSRKFPFADAVRAHAVDEAQHARMYVAMLDLTFPGALSPRDAEALLASYPLYIDEQPPLATLERDLQSLLDDIVQMNIGEVRTRIHQMLLTPVALAVAPAENREQLSAALARIYADEGRHIEGVEDVSAEWREFGRRLHNARLAASTAVLRELGTATGSQALWISRRMLGLDGRMSFLGSVRRVEISARVRP